MSKLRNTLMAVALGTGAMGCSFTHWSVYHCDDCDDFPMPAQGMATSMMPGTYTGPPPQDSRSANSPMSTPAAGAVPPANEQPASPPPVPPTSPAAPR